MSAATEALILAGVGLPIVVGGVALVARHLVYGHAEQHGPAEAARGAAATQAAEAARRAARRQAQEKAGAAH